MQTLHQLLFMLHILVGSMALILFWVPMLSKKGSLDHKRFGRHYANTMYAVAATGAIMALLVIAYPMQIKGHLLKDADPEKFVEAIRRFWFFLLYLSLITFSSVQQGMLALKHKSNNQALRTPINLAICAGLLVGGAFLMYLGIRYQSALHIVFSVLGFSIAVGALKYIFAKQVKPNRWLIEHLAGMVGSGIGAYTAFLAFGGRQLFADLGQWQLVFWIAPGVIGSIAISRYSRKYQSKTINRKQPQAQI